MKIPQNKLFRTVFLVSVSVLVVLCCILVAISDNLTPNTKYSFLALLFAGEAAVIFFILQNYQKQNHENDTQRDTPKDREAALIQKAAELTQRESVLSARETAVKEWSRQLEGVKLAAVGNKENDGASSEVEQLRQKCEALEKFRDGFPYIINSEKNYLLYNVLRTEVSVSSFSRWTLVGEYNGQLWAYSLLRPDIQSYKEMLYLASGTREPRELQELDLSKQLLWK